MENNSNILYAFLELQQDLFFNKIPKEKYRYFIEESIKQGTNVYEEYKGEDILDLYEKNNIQVVIDPGDGEFYKVRLRAQFEFDKAGNHKVYIYRKSIDELAKHIGMDFDTIMKMYLSHEFFHYDEMTKNRVVANQLDSVERAKILGKKLYARVNRTSEIGAHIFAMLMMDLPYMPNYYDYLYLISLGELSSSYLENREAEVNKLLQL